MTTATTAATAVHCSRRTHLGPLGLLLAHAPHVLLVAAERVRHRVRVQRSVVGIEGKGVDRGRRGWTAVVDSWKERVEIDGRRAHRNEEQQQGAAHHAAGEAAARLLWQRWRTRVALDQELHFLRTFLDGVHRRFVRLHLLAVDGDDFVTMEDPAALGRVLRAVNVCSVLVLLHTQPVTLRATRQIERQSAKRARVADARVR